VTMILYYAWLIMCSYDAMPACWMRIGRRGGPSAFMNTPHRDTAVQVDPVKHSLKRL